MTVFIFISIMKRFKKINFIVILSGLFAMKKSNLIVRVCRKLIFLWFLLTVDYLVFTSRSEYEFAINKHTRFKHKFVCLPFSLDTSFWTPSKKVDFSSKKGVLFIDTEKKQTIGLIRHSFINDTKYSSKMDFLIFPKIPKTTFPSLLDFLANATDPLFKKLVLLIVLKTLYATLV